MLEVSRDDKFAKEFKKKRWGAQKEMKEWCWGYWIKRIYEVHKGRDDYFVKISEKMTRNNLKRRVRKMIHEQHLPLLNFIERNINRTSKNGQSKRWKIF